MTSESHNNDQEDNGAFSSGMALPLAIGSVVDMSTFSGVSGGYLGGILYAL
jgi:hypothetical protein